VSIINPKLGAIAFACGLGVAYAQSTPAPKLEVASVKPCSAADPPGGIVATPGRLTATCTPVTTLIFQSYVLYANGSLNLLGERLVPIEKRPAWIDSERYSIEAKSEGALNGGVMRGPMLRALLEDRFKLKIHSETREVPVYALTAAKGGAKLQAAREGSCNPLDFDRPPAPPVPGQPLFICTLSRITPDAYEIRGVTIAQFAVDLSRRLDRDIIDKTGIVGKFDIRVALTPGLAQLFFIPPPPPPGGAAAPPPPAPSNSTDPSDVFDATQTLVEKLGLKLESAKGPGRFLVIDHVERPSAN
jgi:uncharacterized protein (TIGR03435 family)